MSSNVWDAISSVANAVSSFGHKESGSYTPPPAQAYQAEVTKTSTYASKQTDNTMLYLGLGGLGLILIFFGLRR